MDIDQEIAALKIQFNTVERLRLHLKGLEEKRHALVKDQARLELKIEKEYDDYQRVKDQNEQALRNLFLLPDEEKLEKEKQEYFEVVLEVRKIEQELNLIDFEIKILKNKATKIEDLRGKLTDLQKVKTQQLIRDSTEIQVLQQQHDKQGAIIEGIESMNEQGNDCVVRLKEIEDSLYLIKIKEKGREDVHYFTENSRLRGLNLVHNHLAKLQIGFTKMEAQSIALIKWIATDKQQLPDWEKKLAPLREFANDFFLQLIKKNHLNSDFSKSQNQVMHLKFQLEEIIKENRYLIEDHKQIRDRIARDLAVQLKV